MVMLIRWPVIRSRQLTVEDGNTAPPDPSNSTSAAAEQTSRHSASPSVLGRTLLTCMWFLFPWRCVRPREARKKDAGRKELLNGTRTLLLISRAPTLVEEPCTCASRSRPTLTGLPLIEDGIV